MKKITLILLVLLFPMMIFAGNLVIINVESETELKELFSQKELQIHFYNDQFVVATTENFDNKTMILLDKDAFSSSEVYYIIYCKKEHQADYIQRESSNGKMLYKTNNFLIIKPLTTNLYPAKNDGMVAITNTTARLPKNSFNFPVVTEEDVNIRSFMNQVSSDNLLAKIQHLQDYGTRRYNTTQSVEAQNWLFEQFKAMGLEVLLHDFKPGNYSQSSDNVVAIQRGTLYPDEYVVCGSHFDSYANGGQGEPGADDNASGTAAVLESARILSQYSFERSIVYCSFSAEEIGLYGSAAFAQQCAWQDINIVGYFNNDMNGYLKVGDDIHIDLIYPNSAASIGDFYKNVCNIYYPEMEVKRINFTSGDSDHTSFNNNGYVGIYPFEDQNNYSPYIHTSNDIIGVSVNNITQSKRYTEVNISCVATIAGLSSGNCPKVTNLTVISNNQQITLTWDAAIGNNITYDIYRDNQLITTTSNAFYSETIPSGNYVEYCVITNYQDCISGTACTELILTINPPELFVENAYEFSEGASLRISVSNVDGAKSYPIYKQNGTLQGTIYPFFNSIFLTKNIQFGQEYCYTATAIGNINGTAVESAHSALTCGISEIVCMQAQNFAGQYQNNQVALIWTSVTNSEGYNVYRNNELFAENIHTTYFIDNNPPIGNNCYHVKTVCYNGEAEPTNDLCYDVVEINELEKVFSIYPNPAKDKITVECDLMKTVIVFNIVGQLMESINVSEQNSVDINTTLYKPGVYLIKVMTIDGFSVTERVTIQH